MPRRLIQSVYFLICLMAAGGVRAHALRESSEPGAGAVLGAPPAAIVLHFDSVLEPIFCRISIQEAGGDDIVTAPLIGDGRHKTTLRLSLPVLAPNRYTVNWLAVARDGHRTTGDYRFTVKK